MLRTAAKLIMYHGTATGADDEILRRVLKEGLNPTPPKRSFEERGDKPVEERHYESLGGVYFSVNLWDISKFSQIAQQKFGGDRLGVVAQIETTTPTVTIDEDDLFPLSSRNKIADHYFRAVYRVVEASDYMLLSTMEAEKLDYVEMADWWVDNVLREQWDISDAEKRRIIPAVAEVAEAQVSTYLAAENERYKDHYWSNRRLFDLHGPKESAAQLFEQLKQKTREALRVVRKAANPSKIDWRREHHKIRITEPVGYGGANRILAVFHWNDDYDRFKQDGYYIIGEVDYLVPTAKLQIDQIINYFSEHSSEHMLWHGPKGEVLYDQVNPKITQQKAVSLKDRPMYRKAERALRFSPSEPVAFVWLTQGVANEKSVLRLQRVRKGQDPNDALDSLIGNAEIDSYDQHNLGDHGVKPLKELLRGLDLQDAVKQLSHRDVAVIDVATPRTRQIPKRLLVPKHAAAMEPTTEGLLDKLLGILSGVNGMIQDLDDLEMEIHEAKADGEDVAAEANDVIMVAKEVQQHLQEARDVLLSRMEVFLGGKDKEEPKEKEASVRMTGLKRSDKVVVSAFLNHEPAEGRVLQTDGARLWMIDDEDANLAWWDEGAVQTIAEPSTRIARLALVFLRRLQSPEA